MVQKWTDESEMQEEENSQKKANQRFYYQSSKQKANPWASSDLEDSQNHGFPESKQKIGYSGSNKSTNLFANSDFDLESVWSVRKNVPLPSNKKKQSSQLNLPTGNSYYSRHSGLSGGFQAKPASKTESNGDKNGDGVTWNMKRQGYSYTGQGSVKRQANDDDDDEFDFTEPKKKNISTDSSSHSQWPHPKGTNSKAGSLASVTNPQRKGSARTLRAQKMHDAYLRSAGLGDYSSAARNNGFNSP